MSSLHPVRIALYAALAIFSSVLLGLTAARVHYTTNRQTPDIIRVNGRHYTDSVVVELLVTSIFALLWSVPLVFMLHARKGPNLVASYAFEFIGLFVLWIMFLVGASISTNYWHGLGFCSGFNQCRILTAIVAWGWINWGVTTFLLMTSCVGQQTSHSGYGDPLYGYGDPNYGGATAAGGNGVADATYGAPRTGTSPRPETRNVDARNTGPVSTGAGTGPGMNPAAGNMAPAPAVSQYPGQTGAAVV